MKTTKKLIILALALILCLSLAAPALAADSDFVIENGILTKYNGPGGNVVIPSSVTSIGQMAFYCCRTLSRVTIPGSVTSIASDAFVDCPNLTAIQVDAKNQSYCSVEGVVFTKDMKTLIVCPGWKKGAYSIPSGVTSIGVDAFACCSGLTTVTIPNSVTGIERFAFQCCSSLTSLTIPSSVTSIEEGAFAYCTMLTSVTIPSGVTSIEGMMFYNCEFLTSVTIPGSVTSVKLEAFDGCSSLTDVYYGGTEAQWKKIRIDYCNDPLTDAAIHYNSAGTDTPTPQPAASESAMPTNDKLVVNGVLQNPTVYKIGGSNYFKIRDLAAMLNGTEKQFDVGYDGKLASVTLTTGKGYAKLDTDMAGAATGGNQTADPSNDTIYINGQKIDVTVYKIGGSNYFKLRDLGQALDFYVGWTAKDGVFIDTSKPYSA